MTARYLLRSIAVFVFGFVLAPLQAADPVLKLKQGDRISFIGNTLADRMQHAAWLETYLHAAYPNLNLTVRNLGFSGDEIKLRNREDNFGSAEEWLTKTKSSVIFAFFGYNEALRGKQGMDAFQKDLEECIDGMLANKYDGESAPRLVFFSPIAHENLQNPNLPDGKANNERLSVITKMMADSCKVKGVAFVDLFAATSKLYASAAKPLTMNGIHLLDHGDRLVADVIVKELFGIEKQTKDERELERLRQAILDKNYHWFSRYRVVDGYNVFGGRSKLAWFGQSNADVMMREMEMFDVMTANRDVRVWAVAKGSDHHVVDNNLPPEVEVKTNIPGKLEGGKHEYIDGKEAISKMKIADGMQVNLFADEKMFPEVVNPVQMAVDPNGTLFVSVWPSYPHWNPKEPRRDRIIALPDDNGDGVADRCVIFADELNSVTGFEFWGGGMLVAALPELWFLKDTDGDGKSDIKVRMLQGLSSADSHHSANAMLLGPDGWLYWSRGIFNIAAMETPTKTYRSGESGVHRFNPRTFEMEFHFPIGPNPHGDVFDQWGYQFANDGTGGSGSYVNIGKGVGHKPWFKMRVRPVSATGILSSSHFPDKNQGNFLICNCIGFLGILQHEVKYNGADITAEEIEPILVSSDPNFRPTDVEIGGDGAMYVSDWSNAIVGHMQHNMRDPNRDHEHGRIYRVTAKDRPLLKPTKLIGRPINEVLQAFFSKENGVRYRARLELSGRETKDVVPAIATWAAKLDAAQPNDAQALLECLWVHEEHRVPNSDLLKKVYKAKEARVRAAAIRTLGHWGPKIADWEPVLLAAVRDESALVRAEAVKSALSFEGVVGAEVIFEASNKQSDPEMDIVLAYGRSKIPLDKLVADAVNSGRPLSKAAREYALKNASPSDLLKLEKSEVVYEAILNRQNADVGSLRQALAGLAGVRKSGLVPLLLQLIEDRDKQDSVESLATLSQLLAEQPNSELKKVRNRIERLSLSGKAQATRRLAFVTWIVAENSADAALLAASKSKDSLQDFLSAVPSISDEKLRGSLYTAIRSLMFELPPNLKAETAGATLAQPGIQVDFFHPNPGNVAIETLEKRKPQASGVVPEIVMNVPQKLQPDEFALRFTGMIRIPVNGKYMFFVSSDDGSRVYIDNKLLINNDGLHGMVEKQGAVALIAGSHAIVVTYFDNGGGDGLEVRWSGPGFSKQKIPADALTLNGGGETIHDLAIRSLASIPGHGQEKFKDLVTILKSDRNRAAAISLLGTVPTQDWSNVELPGLVDNIIGYLSGIPAQFRNGAPAMEAVALARSYAAKLPTDQAKAIESRLLNLDVRVIALGTVVERMIYDKETIAVQAGKPVEFRFSNTDNMPHNFAIVQPGSLEEIGLAAEATAGEADVKERQYVPKSTKVLIASKLLAPGESQTITFDVPKTPGIYPYVCTYPGHWRRMFGALYVVANLEEYQRAPDQYLTANSLAYKDELLKSIGRNTEWKYDELAASVKKLPDGRSFDVGKKLFKDANCIACHKMNNEGRELGPDLTKIDPAKHTTELLLRSVLEPSKEIAEKYQSYSFLLSSGSTVTGMIVEETPKQIKVLVDPLAKGEPAVIDVSDIEERKKSTLSIMPQGLMSKLTQEEILDLLAYLYSKGDKKHELFGAHGH